MSSLRDLQYPIRLIVAAPYATVRAGLRALVDGDPGIETVGDAPAVGELIRLIGALEPDVVLLDDRLRSWDGLVEELIGHGTALVVVTEDRSDIDLLAGAAVRGWGLLLRGSDGSGMTAAIRAAHAGHIVLDRALSTAVGVPVDVAAAAGALDISAGADALTTRELDVLRLLAAGMPNKQIATRLRITSNTVKFHVAAILAKLGATSRTEAVSIGLRTGRIPL